MLVFSPHSFFIYFSLACAVNLTTKIEKKRVSAMNSKIDEEYSLSIHLQLAKIEKNSVEGKLWAKENQ